MRVDIRLVELKNKGRKGSFVYIKYEGKPARYYRFDGITPLDAYKNYYEDKYIKNRSGRRIKEYKIESGKKKDEKFDSLYARKYKRKVSGLPTIEESVGKGITESKIGDVFRVSNSGVQEVKKELLNSLVLDKSLLNILISRENFSKMKHRLEYRIRYRDEKQVIADTTIFNKTPEEVVKLIRDMGFPEEYIEKAKSPTLAKRLEDNGFTKLNIYHNGYIKRVEVNVIFRKGR